MLGLPTLAFPTSGRFLMAANATVIAELAGDYPTYSKIMRG
jgi:hypothetical protein